MTPLQNFLSLTNENLANSGVDRIDEELDSRRSAEPWGVMEWLSSAEIGNSRDVTLGKMSIEPGGVNDSHSHSNCEEVQYLLTGLLEQRVGDRVYLQKAGDVIVVPPNTVHQTKNVGPDRAELLIVFSAGRRNFALHKS